MDLICLGGGRCNPGRHWRAPAFSRPRELALNSQAIPVDT
jgi:hypothetical protein